MRSVLACFLVLVAVEATKSENLYRVRLINEADYAALAQCSVEPVIRVADGMLVIAGDRACMSEHGLEVFLVTQGVDRRELAIDLKQDTAPIAQDIIYQDGPVKIVRFDNRTGPSTPDEKLVPLSELHVPIVVPRQSVYASELMHRAAIRGLDLSGLIGQVSTDTLSAHSHTLEAFGIRVCGYAENAAARDWEVSLLESYGLDSVWVDTWVDTFSTGRIGTFDNVVAMIRGTRYPSHYMVVGAHRDAVPGSPGADDNGSGTIALLEMARILSTTQPELSIVFVLFDAEETGLHGSNHFARTAYVRGDSIVCMINMDMIGDINNIDSAVVYGDERGEVGHLWMALADSLAGLEVRYNSGVPISSDHVPFYFHGWEVATVHEYKFSSVYHSPYDSTTHLSYPYLTKMTQAMVATVHTISMTWGPPVLTFDFSHPAEVTVAPFTPTEVEFGIRSPYGGIVTPGSARLLVTYDEEPTVTLEATELPNGNFTASLAPRSPGTIIEMRAAAADDFRGQVVSGNALRTQVGIRSDLEFIDDFSTDRGWTVTGTVTAGKWERAVPNLGGTQGAPHTDSDGSGRCFVTGNGNGPSDVDNGSTILTSPTFDGRGRGLLIHYALWYATYYRGEYIHGQAQMAAFEDILKIYLSNNNGGSWILLDSVGPRSDCFGGWHIRESWAHNLLPPSAEMKLRFEVSDLVKESAVEAALDDIQIITFDTLAKIRELHCLGELTGHVINHTPTLSWRSQCDLVCPQESLEVAVLKIQLPPATVWTFGPTAFTDSLVIYQGIPLIDQANYGISVRTWSSYGWTPWTTVQIHMNDQPSQPPLTSPGYAEIAPPLCTFRAGSSTDGDATDTVRCQFMVYSDSLLTNISASGLVFPDETGYTWTVPQPLEDNSVYWWRVRAHDGYEYSNWSPARKCVISSENEPPTEFAVVSPPDLPHKTVFTLTPVMNWNKAADPDPGDVVTYYVWVSRNPQFNQNDSLITTDTSVTLTNPLLQSSHYWWKVTAQDRAGRQSVSNIEDFWTWYPADLNSSHTADLSDLSAMIAFLTAGYQLDCPRLVGDITTDCRIDLSDLARMISFLVGQGPALQPGCQ